MLKIGRFILITGLMLCGDRPLRAQMFVPPGPPSGAPVGQVPPEMAEMQRVQARLMKEAAPELYAFQEKLRVIDAEIGKIVASLTRKEIDREAAKENMLPLIKERQEIQNDPEFQAERRLALAVYASPEYQKKMGAVMRAHAEKRKRKGNR